MDPETLANYALRLRTAGIVSVSDLEKLDSRSLSEYGIPFGTRRHLESSLNKLKSRNGQRGDIHRREYEPRIFCSDERRDELCGKDEDVKLSPRVEITRDYVTTGAADIVKDFKRHYGRNINPGFIALLTAVSTDENR